MAKRAAPAKITSSPISPPGCSLAQWLQTILIVGDRTHTVGTQIRGRDEEQRTDVPCLGSIGIAVRCA